LGGGVGDEIAGACWDVQRSGVALIGGPEQEAADAESLRRAVVEPVIDVVLGAFVQGAAVGVQPIEEPHGSSDLVFYVFGWLFVLSWSG
jgi:hypothetical protein